MYDWIENSAALQALCSDLASAEAIGLDTEFMRVRTFWPELALVQVAQRTSTAIVDPVPLPDLDCLVAVLVAAAPVKVMHSSSEDLVAFSRVGASPLLPLFDTQVAAAFAGLGAGMGYQRLVQHLLGIELVKTETRSNWLLRPLTAEQLSYAAADVAHLLALHELLREMLATRGMLAWCLEDCERLARNATAELAPANPHWDFRHAWRWAPERQAKLKRLLHWREALARSADRPRLWVLDNETVVDLLERPPTDMAGLKHRIAAQRSFPRSEHEALLEQLALPLSDEDMEFAPIPTPLKGDGERAYAELRDRAAAIATELGLPPALLLPRRLIESVVRGERPAELAGWRGEVLRDVLANFANPQPVLATAIPNPETL